MTQPFIFLPAIQHVHSEDAAAIHSVMARYYQGVEEARVDLLVEVFHPAWLMKDTDTPGASTLNVEDKAGQAALVPEQVAQLEVSGEVHEPRRGQLKTARSRRRVELAASRGEGQAREESARSPVVHRRVYRESKKGVHV